MAQRIDELTALLRGLPPRSEQALRLRLLKGTSREECAAFYGISPEAFDVKLLRSARELAAAERRAPPGAPLPFPEEEARARALAKALEEPGAISSSAEAKLLHELAAAAAPLQAALEEAERLAEASPRRKRNDILRWVAIAAIVLVTVYFLLRGQTPS